MVERVGISSIPAQVGSKGHIVNWIKHNAHNAKDLCPLPGEVKHSHTLVMYYRAREVI